MLSLKIFTSLHIIIYIGGGGGGGGGWGVGGRNIYLHIGQIMQGSLSLSRGVVGGKNCFCTRISASGIP